VPLKSSKINKKFINKAHFRRIMTITNRRDFLRCAAAKIAGTTILLGFTASLVSPLVYGSSTNTTDTSPVSGQVKHDVMKPHQTKHVLNGVPVELYGVAHSKDFAENCFPDLEERIKGSYAVVCELNPEMLKS